MAYIISSIMKTYFLNIFFEDPLNILLISSCLALGIYIIGLYLVEEIHKQNIIFIYSLFKFKTYKESYFNELKE